MISNLSLEDTKNELYYLKGIRQISWRPFQNSGGFFVQNSLKQCFILTLEVPSLTLSIGNDLVALIEAHILPPFPRFLHFTGIEVADTRIIKKGKETMNAI